MKFFEQPYIEVRTLGGEIAETSRKICRIPNTNGKLQPKDAVHVATAVHLGLGKLHTFDKETLMAFTDMFRLKDAAIVKICLPEYTPPKEMQDDRDARTGQKNFLDDESIANSAVVVKHNEACDDKATSISYDGAGAFLLSHSRLRPRKRCVLSRRLMGTYRL